MACAAGVSLDGVSHQAAPNNSLGSKSPGRLPRPGQTVEYHADRLRRVRLLLEDLAGDGA